MALPGDEIKVIDKASPWRGSAGKLVSGDFRGRYIAELEGTPSLQARVELTDAQFIVTRAVDDPVIALRPFAEAARWYDEDLPDDFVVLTVGEAVIGLGDLRRAARIVRRTKA